jgi:hypothetical protein
MKKMIALIIGITMFIAANAFAADISDIMTILKSAKQSIDSTLTGIGEDLETAAKKLSATDLKDSAAREILTDLLKYRPYVIDCSIIDTNGVKITVEPAEYKQYEGANRIELPSVIELLKTKKPHMSDVYHSAEGIHAISIGYPIFSDKGEFMGAVRMLIRYEMFLKPLVENKPCKMWVMQTNGLIVYDRDPNEIEKNIFSDDMFKPFDDLISFSRTVALSDRGAGSYSFYADGLKDKTLVDKIATWDTVGIYGAEWRLIAMEAVKPVGQPTTATTAKTE